MCDEQREARRALTQYQAQAGIEGNRRLYPPSLAPVCPGSGSFFIDGQGVNGTDERAGHGYPCLGRKRGDEIGLAQKQVM